MSTCLFCVWVSYLTDLATTETRSEAYLIAVSCNCIGVLLVTVSLLSFLPYFSLLFKFLNTQALIDDLMLMALQCTREESTVTKLSDPEACNVYSEVIGAPNKVKRLTYANQKFVHTILREVSWLGVFSIKRKDKANVGKAIHSISAFARSYIENKHLLNLKWFDCLDTRCGLRELPEFSVLTEDRIEKIRDRKTWVEFLILRQFLVLFSEDLEISSGIGPLIAIETRRLGVFILQKGKIECLGLILKTFNTYIRKCLRGRNVKVIFNVYYQYR